MRLPFNPNFFKGIRKFQIGKIFLRQESSQSRHSTMSLDGLRGFAAIGVFCKHLSEHNINLLPFLDFSNSSSGRAGVYLFFVLSSFLLSGKLLKEQNFDLKNSRMWANYLKKRILRIYPAYIFLLVIYCLFPGFNYNLTNFFKHIFLLEGFGHFWTIPVEFFYYLLLPFLIYLMVVVAQKKILKTTAILLGLNFIIYVTGWADDLPQSPQTPSFFPFTSVFFAGMIAALINIKIQMWDDCTLKKLRKKFKWFSWISISLIFLLTFYGYSLISELVIIPLYGLLWSIFLISHLYARGFLSFILSHPLLRFLGAISFGIYLWHIAVLGYINAHFNVPELVKFFAILIITIVIAVFSYIFIERPFMMMKNFYLMPSNQHSQEKASDRE